MRTRVSMVAVFAVTLAAACGYDPHPKNGGVNPDGGGGNTDGAVADKNSVASEAGADEIGNSTDTGEVPGIDSNGTAGTDGPIATGSVEAGGEAGNAYDSIMDKPFDFPITTIDGRNETDFRGNDGTGVGGTGGVLGTGGSKGTGGDPAQDAPLATGGTGGIIVIGGTTGLGGATVTGGTVGSGGTPGTGGIASSGGATGAGGVPSTGGVVATGGTAGGTGGATKGNGVPCDSGTECTSGNCADGYCCDKPCGGCNACAASLTGSQSGICAPTPAGSNPHSTCTADPPCGHDGACDGLGACRFQPATALCSNESCNGTSHTPAIFCTGSGGCGTASPNTCANHLACGSSQCRTTCSTNTDCAPGYMCPSPGSTSCVKVGAWVDVGARIATSTLGPQVVPTGPCTVGEGVLLLLANAPSGYQIGWEVDTSAVGDWCRTAQNPYYCKTAIRRCGTTSPTWAVWRECSCFSGWSSAPIVWTDSSYVENACSTVGGQLIVEEYNCL